MKHNTHLSVMLVSLDDRVPFVQDITCFSFHATRQMFRYWAKGNIDVCLCLHFVSFWLTEQVYCSQSYSYALKKRWTFEVEIKLFHTV